MTFLLTFILCVTAQAVAWLALVIAVRRRRPVRELPMYRKCACRHGSHEHGDDGTGSCRVAYKRAGETDYANCTCLRFTIDTNAVLGA